MANIALIFFAVLSTVQPTPPPPLPSATLGAPPGDPADVASPAALVQACYAVISGPPGPRDWKRFRSLFLPGARLTVISAQPDGSVRLVQEGVGDYVARDAPYFKAAGFYERGIGNKIVEWAHTSVIRSLYESRHSASDARPFQRGANYFQLMNDGKRWWIASLAWEDETPATPLPPDTDP